MAELPAEELSSLIAQARAGDGSALARLCELYREPLLRRVRWMMGERVRRIAESADFVQATFVAALPRLVGFETRGEGSFMRWLTTIARNQIRQDLRQRREETLSMLSSTLSGRPHPDPSADDNDRLASILSLVEALEGLSERERQVVDLHDFESCPFIEIGRRLGCSERQAHRLHAQALLRLGRVLGTGNSHD